MLATNEYSQLKTVIVGDATGALVPKTDTSMRCVHYAAVVKDSELPSPGPYPQQVIDEANEDLQTLISFLQGEGVRVRRPDSNYSPSYYKFCPRDNVFVHGNSVLYAPMCLDARKNEYLAYTKHFDWTDKLNKKAIKIERAEQLYNRNCIGNKNILALNELEPCFDAANVLRNNNDVFYLVSNSGNHKGADALQEFLGDTAVVHKIEDVYSYMHLDSTMAFLKEGLLLLNPSRIKNKEQLPTVLHNWDIIWAPEPVDIGHYKGYCNSSPWVSVNLLSISEQLVVLEQNQNNLRKVLEAHKIDCAMLPMRQARTLGGCFHCVTLDLERKNV